MTLLGPKPWVNLFGKISIFRLCELFVFIAQKGFFFVVKYPKTHFRGLYCLKKKDEKWPIFDQNHGLTLLEFEKSQFFDFLKLLFLQPIMAFSSFQDILKHIFLALIALKRKVEKLSSFDQNHGLNPLEESQFFDCLNFLFLQARKAFFSSTIS